MSIESVVPANHLIFCCPCLLPSIFPSIRVFSSELALRIRWPEYWSFNFSMSPSNKYSGLINYLYPNVIIYPNVIMTTNRIDEKTAFSSVLSDHMRAVWGMSLYILTVGTRNCKWNRFWTIQLWELWVWKVPLWLVLIHSCAPPSFRPLIWSFFLTLNIYIFLVLLCTTDKSYIYLKSFPVLKW